MNIKQERQFIQELLESGKLDSLSVQVIALNIFANSIGYSAVGGDVRKGFTQTCFKSLTNFVPPKFISLEHMQSCYNNGYLTVRTSRLKIPRVTGEKVVERISIQYNKKLGKLKTQLYWLKF